MNVPSSGKKGSKSPSFSLSQTLQGKCGCGLSIHRKLRICMLNLIISAVPQVASRKSSTYTKSKVLLKRRNLVLALVVRVLYVCLVNG